MKAVCISASNIFCSGERSVTYRFCKIIKESLEQKEWICNILDLREYDLTPCIGCGKCFESKRCCKDDDFNAIYEEIIQADCVFFVSPHYAPIPAKLSMLLEKMEEITFSHWWKDNSYKSEMYELTAGIISHGGGSDWALASYKAMVNDTIANALDTIQCKVVPYNSDWNTGISIPVVAIREEEGPFPKQIYEWYVIKDKLVEYVDMVIKVVLEKSEKDIARIQQMECCLDELTEVMQHSPNRLFEDGDLQRKLKVLTDYYDNGQWLKDFERDEKGELPKDLKRGVLSEDAVYNLLFEIEQYRSAAECHLD